MQLKKLMIEVMVFFVLGCFLCACGKTKDQTRKTTKDANKEIMIGGDNYPPFNYTDENGNQAGIDVEFAREAFHRMGYKPVFVNIDWENKKNLVEQGKIDCIWACFSVTGRENDYHCIRYSLIDNIGIKWTVNIIRNSHLISSSDIIRRILT